MIKHEGHTFVYFVPKAPSMEVVLNCFAVKGHNP
jgi:hypothetical protein